MFQPACEQWLIKLQTQERITMLAAEKGKTYKLHTADFILLGTCGRCQKIIHTEDWVLE